MKHDIQIQLAQWIEQLRINVSTVNAVADWMDENNIPSQQMREAAKYIGMAHSVWITKPMKNKKGKERKFFGSTWYFTKFKTICVSQRGYTYKILITERNKFATNKNIKGHPCYKAL